MVENNFQKVSNKDIIHQIINCSLKHRRIMQNYLDATGVFHAQHRLLMEIARNPNVSQNDIAKIMDVSAATIAVSLKKLEKGGYITREMVEADNRLNKLSMTAKGNKIVNQSKEIFALVDDRIFTGFTEEEKITLAALLQKLDNNIIIMEEEIKDKKERK